MRVGSFFFFFFQAEDGIRDYKVTGVQTCALPICQPRGALAREDEIARNQHDVCQAERLPVAAQDATDLPTLQALAHNQAELPRSAFIPCEREQLLEIVLQAKIAAARAGGGLDQPGRQPRGHAALRGQRFAFETAPPEVLLAAGEHREHLAILRRGQQRNLSALYGQRSDLRPLSVLLAIALVLSLAQRARGIAGGQIDGIEDLPLDG